MGRSLDLGSLQNSTLGVVFRISRALSIAPITFNKNHMQISRQLVLMSYLLLTLLNCALVTGFILDYLAQPARSIRMPMLSSCLVWAGNLTNVMVVTGVGVYMAPFRINCVINMLHQISKINKSIGYINTQGDKKWQKILVLIIIIIFILILLDIYRYGTDAIENEKEVKVMGLYVIFYYEYLCYVVLECQFISVGFRVQSLFGAINERLTNLHRLVEMRYNIKTPICNVNSSRKKNIFVPREASINKVSYRVDTFTISDNDSSDLNTIAHNLSMAFNATCGIVGDINSGFGLLMLWILMTGFFELIVVPYYFFLAISETSSLVEAGPLHIFLQIAWTIHHLICIWCTVEPAHQMNNEIEATKILVGRLLTRVRSPDDPLYAKLNMFTSLLLLNKPTFAPLGLCTLSRQLCVQMLGAVTTYLVILFQFRSNDTKGKAEGN